MGYVLRSYQTQAVERGVRFLRGGAGAGGLIVLPSGAGKSLVIAETVRALDAPCLIFQPSKEILVQNANKLLAYGYTPAVYSASMGQKDVGTVTLATIGSVRTTPELFQQFPYVMIDEAHRVDPKQGMYAEFLAALGDVRLLGLTATPFRLVTDGYGGSQLKFLTRTRPLIFQHVVAYAQVRDLMAQGYLVQPTYQAVPGFSRAALQVNTTGADYTDDSVRRYYNQVGFADRLRRVVERLREVGRKHVLVFTRFVDEAEALAQAVPGAAVVSVRSSPKQRDAVIEGFRAGEIPVLANVGVVGTGFDFPALDTVVLARPTVSLALAMQQAGRVVRPHPTKTSAWVVDMVDQLGAFGKLEDLWLQPGGASGTLWEMVSKTETGERKLTNTYLNVGDFRRRPSRRRWGR